MIVTREISIDYGHTLPNHFGFCNQIHGHRARIVAHFEGDVKTTKDNFYLPDNGMVVDFGFCKKLLLNTIHEQLDHGFAVWENDTNAIAVPVSVEYDNEGVATTGILVSTLQFIKARNRKVVVCSAPPTAEYLAEWAFRLINKDFALYEESNTVKLIKIEWWETPNNCAIYEPASSRFVQLDKEGE